MYIYVPKFTILYTYHIIHIDGIRRHNYDHRYTYIHSPHKLAHIYYTYHISQHQNRIKGHNSDTPSTLPFSLIYSQLRTTSKDHECSNQIINQ